MMLTYKELADVAERVGKIAVYDLDYLLMILDNKNKACAIFAPLKESEKENLLRTFANDIKNARTDIPALLETVRVLREKNDRLHNGNLALIESLSDVVNQACYNGDTLDSGALSAYADAILLLEEAGKVEVLEAAGRRVIATWKTDKGKGGNE